MAWTTARTSLGAEQAPTAAFTFGFHHGRHGSYDGWTHHTAVVTPSFDGINLRITGVNRNGIKQYLHDLFHFALNEARENWIVETSSPT